MPTDSIQGAEAEKRLGETSIPLPEAQDAGLFFIGHVETPWKSRDQCPKRGDLEGPVCRVVLDERWAEALDGIEGHDYLQVLYWMHHARRDLTRQRPRKADRVVGTFALRSPMRPNPIASSVVRLIGRAGNVLLVRGLDCLDGTPLVDIKPEHCPVWRPDVSD